MLDYDMLDIGTLDITASPFCPKLWQCLGVGSASSVACIGTDQVRQEQC